MMTWQGASCWQAKLLQGPWLQVAPEKPEMRTQVSVAEPVAELAAVGAVAAVAHDERVTTAVGGMARMVFLPSATVNLAAPVGDGGEVGRYGAPIAEQQPFTGLVAARSLARHLTTRTSPGTPSPAGSRWRCSGLLTIGDPGIPPRSGSCPAPGRDRALAVTRPARQRTQTHWCAGSARRLGPQHLQRRLRHGVWHQIAGRCWPGKTRLGAAPRTRPCTCGSTACLRGACGACPRPRRAQANTCHEAREHQSFHTCSPCAHPRDCLGPRRRHRSGGSRRAAP